jgi:hypothetical protein
MARDDFERLRAAVLADDALQTRLREPGDGTRGFVDRVITLGAEQDLDLAAADVDAAIAQSRRAWIERWLG